MVDESRAVEQRKCNVHVMVRGGSMAIMSEKAGSSRITR